ncbi:MAG: hypothetical protein QW613_01430 [Thermoprotei archaeon]
MDKRISSLDELFDAIAKLEIDEGVRVNGKVGGKRCYIFVTKSSNGYTMAVFEPGRGNSGLGKQRLIEDSVNFERVKRFISERCEEPLKAFRY